MKKEKVTITITIGIICFILTMAIFIQINTTEQTNVREIQRQGKKELEEEIKVLKTQINDKKVETEEIISKTKEFADVINKGKEASELLERELQKRKDLLGQTRVTGQGIIITLSSGTATVNIQDLLDLVNQLKSAGAEAISINDKRIVYDSYIVSINGAVNFVSINSSKAGEPYVVKAIGNISHLESGVAQKKYGYIDTKILEGKNVVLEKYESITIEPYKGRLDFEHVKEGN